MIITYAWSVIYTTPGDPYGQEIGVRAINREQAMAKAQLALGKNGKINRAGLIHGYCKEEHTYAM